MKSIKLKNIGFPDKESVFTDQRLYSVNLGNGIKRQFANKTHAKAFLAEVSRYLTYKLHECSELYIDVFTYWRRAWFYFDHNRYTGSHDYNKWYKLERSCKDQIEIISEVMDRIYIGHVGENGNYFVFNNFYTVLDAMEKLVRNINAIYENKGNYGTIYELEILNRKILGCRRTIETYTEDIEKKFNEAEEIQLTLIKTGTESI